MISFWEKQTLLSYDYVIVGGGIVGLSTAASLLEQRPQLKVAVLERGLLPAGASTKNAGFACFAKACELMDDLNLRSADEVVQTVADRFAGLQRLRERLGNEAIDYQALGGYELIRSEDTFDESMLQYVNELLYPVFKQPVFAMKNESIKLFGFKQVEQLIYTPLEGQLDTGKMMQALMQWVQQLGARVFMGCEVTDIDEDHKVVSCTVLQGDTSYTIKADKVALCTNAFTSTFLPELGVKPGRGQVLITKPVEGLKFKGTFHFDRGYYYFRNFGNRVLFGGGRQLDFDTETTNQFGENAKIYEQLEVYLNQMILPDHTFEIDMKWSGIMGFHERKAPVIQKNSPRVVVGFSCNGMGIALGSTAGDQVADLLTQ